MKIFRQKLLWSSLSLLKYFIYFFVISLKPGFKLQFSYKNDTCKTKILVRTILLLHPLWVRFLQCTVHFFESLESKMSIFRLYMPLNIIKLNVKYVWRYARKSIIISYLLPPPVNLNMQRSPLLFQLLASWFPASQWKYESPSIVGSLPTAEPAHEWWPPKQGKRTQLSDIPPHTFFLRWESSRWWVCMGTGVLMHNFLWSFEVVVNCSLGNEETYGSQVLIEFQVVYNMEGKST